MKNLFLVIASLVTFNFSAQADEVIKVPISEDLIKPIVKCSPIENKEISYEVNGLLKQAQQSFNCGQLEEAAFALEDALELVAHVDQVAKGGRGWCYSVKDCGRPKVSAQMVTEKQCKGTNMKGLSWKQITPKVGKCKNI